MSFSVGQVARLAGITVRTLHHYDEIGLLSPGERSAAGYRRYTDDDLVRLQQILFYRELDFGLEEIAVILDDPQVDEMTHLRRQHELLQVRLGRVQDLLAAVELAMEARGSSITLTAAERLEVFGSFKPEEHEAEAERRWGGGREFAESRRRVASYGKAEWLQLREEGEQLMREVAQALKAGLEPDDPRVMDLAERHRGYISRWFYDCGYAVHRGLGQLYVEDPRFTEAVDQVMPGVAAFLREAIEANADRYEG
ncbi:MerR family transcriptional regulator [Nonomuraea sp. NPDC050310]|uniref:MerR family transcriptional regulator n=1 Tax=Nonomuraea sp. NPDC050310 TaxID=3154935 RepID=UPI0033CFECEE